MNSITRPPKHLGVAEITARALAAVAEGRIVPHERMAEWFEALEHGEGDDPEPPQTDVEIEL